MPLDPQFQTMIDAMDTSMSVRTLPLAELRAFVRQSSMAAGPLDVPLAAIRDDEIPGPGGPLRIRIYTPEGSGPFPLTMFFHGGGFVVGDLDTQDMIARALSHRLASVVVSVDYRLAPEHKFPAAPEDAYAATTWAAANAQALGADAERLIVAGDSAGALLAASVAMASRDRGGPPIAAQILFYGSCDYPSEETPSAVEYVDGPFITGDDIDFFWSQYLGDPEREQHDVRASPMRAKDHSRLAPAFVVAPECDPTRDHAEAYGAKLKAASVPTEVRRYPGMPHGFVSWLGMVPAASQAVDDAVTFVRQQLAEKVA